MDTKKEWIVKIPEQEVFEKNKEINDDGETFDYHQTVLNIGYKWWQDAKNPNDVDYVNMIDYIANTYGEIFAGLILIGKYNQQVSNNGHDGYYNNGFADGIGGCYSKRDFDHPLHRRLISWFEKIIEENQNKDYIDDLNNAFNVVKKFMDIPIDTEEYIEEEVYLDEDDEDYDDSNVEYEEVENNDYGQMDVTFANKLNKEYYEVGEQMMKALEQISEELLNGKYKRD